jgi:hypothetical protein
MGESVLVIVGAPPMGHFQCFAKIHFGLSQKPDVLEKTQKHYQ